MKITEEKSTKTYEIKELIDEVFDKETEKLKNQLAEAEEALKFYSSLSNWNGKWMADSVDASDCDYQQTVSERVGGKRAKTYFERYREIQK
jgi:hypothetical protein